MLLIIFNQASGVAEVSAAKTSQPSTTRYIFTPRTSRHVGHLAFRIKFRSDYRFEPAPKVPKPRKAKPLARPVPVVEPVLPVAEPELQPQTYRHVGRSVIRMRAAAGVRFFSWYDELQRLDELLILAGGDVVKAEEGWKK